MGSRYGEVEQVVPALQITRVPRRRRSNVEHQRGFNDYMSKSKRYNAPNSAAETSSRYGMGRSWPNIEKQESCILRFPMRTGSALVA